MMYRNAHHKRIGRRGFAGVLILILLMALATADAAESYSAQSMRLLRYDGDVIIEDASGEPRFVTENVRFASGEAMRTGEDSHASVGLDDTKIVTLDAESRAEFLKQGNSVHMNLTEGSIFLDVQEKLDENETFDIQTSTMTVGIRGTIVFVSVDTEADGAPGATTTLGVLEGAAQVNYQDADGTRRLLEVPAGQKAVTQATKEHSALEISALEMTDLSQFVSGQIQEDPVVAERVAPVLEQIGEGADNASENPFPADGDWIWDGSITLVARSASKLYDGTPLARPSDVLVQGLPNAFSIQASAGGSQTDAGAGANLIAHYAIYNAAGEDVTSHFPHIEKVSGILRVDPAPLSIWTGSAEKFYDGTPLTNKEAGIRTVPGYVADEPAWRNSSYVMTGAFGSQTMISLSGVTWVHGSNPLTGETQEIRLYAGQRVTVILHEEGEEQNIEFQVETISEEEIPEDILRIYADNPKLLKQAIADTGWDAGKIARLIDALPQEDRNTVEQTGLRVENDAAEYLMNTSVNVRINLDTEITNYNRPLGGDEAQFTPVRLDESIRVRATGSQTKIGSSINTYEIDWGTANPANYIVQADDLGTLTVRPAPKKAEKHDEPLTVTAPSVSKVYDGLPLDAGSSDVALSGLPSGFTLHATVSGSLTDAGTAESRIDAYQILDANGQDVTNQFTNVTVQGGTLTITPATLTIQTGSAGRAYDGTPLSSTEVTVTGLAGDDTAEVVTTGSITNVGTASNTYTLDWGTTNSSNYTVTEKLGTLEVTVNDTEIIISAASAEKAYDGLPLTEANYTVSALPAADSSVLATVEGTQTDAGESENTITSYRILNAEEQDITAAFSNVVTVSGKLTVSRAEVTISTGSDTKAYDGTPLSSTEVTVTGLAGDDTAEVVTTGSITNVGTASNTYTLDWGTTNSSNYTVTEKLGTLTVTQNSNPVLITAASATKAFDGAVLKDDTFTVSGLPEGVMCIAEVAGSQEAPGTSANTVEGYAILDAEEQDVTGNFTAISTAEGTLTVTVNDSPIVITAPSDSWTYTGIPVALTGGGSVEGLPEGIFCMLTPTSPELLNAGTYTTGISYYLTDDELGPVDDYFTNITVVPGTITIQPAPVTVTTASASKVYDGTPLISPEVEITGLVGEETAEAEATGSITDAGSVENACMIYWGETLSSNYAVTENIGMLTVEPLQITFNLGGQTQVFDPEQAYYAAGFDPEAIQGIYGNGSQSGNKVEQTTSSAVVGKGTYGFLFLTGDGVSLEVNGLGNTPGTYTITGTLTFLSGNADNYSIGYTNNKLVITEE